MLYALACAAGSRPFENVATNSARITFKVCEMRCIGESPFVEPTRLVIHFDVFSAGICYPQHTPLLQKVKFYFIA